MRRLVLVLTAALALVALAIGSASAAAPTATVDEAIALVHASRGTADLVGRSDLHAVAQRHAERMAAENRLYHNPSLGREVTGYELVGENVGVGPGELGPIHQAFMDSPSHRANLLDARYSEIGIGLATGSDGSLWIVQVFRQPIVAAAAPAPAPAPAPVPAPAAPVAEAPAPVPAVEPVQPVAPPVADPTPELVRTLAETFVWPAATPVRTSTVDIDLSSAESALDMAADAVPAPAVAAAAVMLVLVALATLRVERTANGVAGPRALAA